MRWSKLKTKSSPRGAISGKLGTGASVVENSLFSSVPMRNHGFDTFSSRRRSSAAARNAMPSGRPRKVMMSLATPSFSGRKAHAGRFWTSTHSWRFASLNEALL